MGFPDESEGHPLFPDFSVSMEEMFAQKDKFRKCSYKTRTVSLGGGAAGVISAEDKALTNSPVTLKQNDTWLPTPVKDRKDRKEITLTVR